MDDKQQDHHWLLIGLLCAVGFVLVGDGIIAYFRHRLANETLPAERRDVREIREMVETGEFESVYARYHKQKEQSQEVMDQISLRNFLGGLAQSQGLFPAHFNKVYLKSTPFDPPGVKGVKGIRIELKLDKVSLQQVEHFIHAAEERRPGLVCRELRFEPVKNQVNRWNVTHMEFTAYREAS